MEDKTTKFEHIMKRINEFFKGRIGRFNYLLSYLEYSWCLQRHKDLCSITGEPSKHDKLGGAFCPKCLSTNVAKIVYGYPAKGWGALAEDKKSYFHGCVIPRNPKKYHCNDCKYEWGGF